MRRYRYTPKVRQVTAPSLQVTHLVVLFQQVKNKKTKQVKGTFIFLMGTIIPYSLATYMSFTADQEWSLYIFWLSFANGHYENNIHGFNACECLNATENYNLDCILYLKNKSNIAIYTFFGDTWHTSLFFSWTMFYKAYKNIQKVILVHRIKQASKKN